MLVPIEDRPDHIPIAQEITLQPVGLANSAKRRKPVFNHALVGSHEHDTMFLDLVNKYTGSHHQMESSSRIFHLEEHIKSSAIAAYPTCARVINK